MIIIDGKEVSKKIKSEVKEAVSNLPNQPKLLVVLVGDDPASQVYVASKEKACKNCGIDAETIVLDGSSSQEDVLNVIRKANKDTNVNGILVQMPLPKHLNSDEILNEIDPNKDVDGLTYINQGKLLASKKGLVPCTPKGIMRLFKEYDVDLCGKSAIVIGRSLLVGKPIALLMTEKNATVTLAHSKTEDLKELCKEKDIIVAAAGRAKMVTSDMVKKDAVIIDVGINRVDGKIIGDVDFENVCETVSKITPVPGGVGPMTIACLLENVVECYKIQNNIE